MVEVVVAASREFLMVFIKEKRLKNKAERAENWAAREACGRLGLRVAAVCKRFSGRREEGRE